MNKEDITLDSLIPVGLSDDKSNIECKDDSMEM